MGDTIHEVLNRIPNTVCLECIRPVLVDVNTADPYHVLLPVFVGATKVVIADTDATFVLNDVIVWLVALDVAVMFFVTVMDATAVLSDAVLVPVKVLTVVAPLQSVFSKVSTTI